MLIVMTAETQIPAWQAALQGSFETLSGQLGASLPQIAGVLGLLIAGFVIAHILRLVTDKSLHGLERVIRRITGARDPHQRGARPRVTLLPVIAGKLVFWFVLVIFIIAGASQAGLQLTGKGWLAHLPHIAVGFVIILASIIAGSLSHKLAHAFLVNYGYDHAGMIAFSLQLFLITAGIIIGLEQTGINLGFLTNLIIVIAGVVLAGACLAFGLGARTLVADMIAAQQAARHLRPGETVEINHVRGTLVEITQNALVLETPEGRSLVPARFVQKHIIHVPTPRNGASSHDIST